MKAVIDIDTLLIHSALAAQENYVTVTHKPSGKVMEFPTQTEFFGHYARKDGGWLAERNKVQTEQGKPIFHVDDFEITQNVRLISLSQEGEMVPPERIAKGRLKSKINFIISQPWCTGFIIPFGQGKNFRYNVAQTQAYKQGRPPKPLLYDAVKDYLLYKYKDHLDIVTDVETDDRVCQLLWESWIRSGRNHDNLDSVGVFIDKDITQVPCLWYNFDKPDIGLTKITSVDAARSLAKQMILGDNCDSILGLPKLATELHEKYKIRKSASLGATTADNLLKDIHTPKEMFERVVEAYRALYGDDKKPWTSFRGDNLEWNYLDYMNETFKLVRMQVNGRPVEHVSEFLKRLGVDIEKEKPSED